jgi:hypothetical protein
MWQAIRKLVTRMPRRSVVDVGWLLSEERASLIWDDPQPVRRARDKPLSAKSVQVCPAAIDFDARHFVVPCPVDVHLRLKLEQGKPPALENVDGLKSTVRSKTLGQMVTIINRPEWRHPDKPILQFTTPYVFLADDPVYINQVPPYLDYIDPAWPGVPISGRFPIHIWPRHLVWAFEWHDTTKDLILARGQPWFYVSFETYDPTSRFRLVEAEMTPDVRRYVESIVGVTNYVNRTFSLFERAKRRRPKTLLVKATSR